MRHGAWGWVSGGLGIRDDANLVALEADVGKEQKHVDEHGVEQPVGEDHGALAADIHLRVMRRQNGEQATRGQQQIGSGEQSIFLTADDGEGR